MNCHLRKAKYENKIARDIKLRKHHYRKLSQQKTIYILNQKQTFKWNKKIRNETHFTLEHNTEDNATITNGLEITSFYTKPQFTFYRLDNECLTFSLSAKEKLTKGMLDFRSHCHFIFPKSNCLPKLNRGDIKGFKGKSHLSASPPFEL